jgi:hypothetical protein
MAEIPSRYLKPRVLLIDLPEAATEALRELGLNVNSGTFGPRYSVPVCDENALIEAAPDLPGYAEQEIVVLDNSPTEPVPYPRDGRKVVDSVPHIVTQCGYGVVDTRPLAMTFMKELGDRILDSGGLFLVFASMLYTVEYLCKNVGNRYQPYSPSTASNWNFLSFFGENYFSTEPHVGTEMREVERDLAIHNPLRRFLAKSKYKCTFRKDWLSRSDDTLPMFVPILLSKYGDAVAGYILSNSAGGAVIILPQIEDKAGILVELFKNYLPAYHARLFPEHEGDRWVHRAEYEHPAILDKVAHQFEIQRRADAEKAAIDVEIADERTRLAFLHGLLTKSGDELVADVKAALEFIGFNRVVDVDVAEKDRANKQEDLQILDRPTKVLVEVKGLGGLPREANTLQVIKFMMRRFRDWVWPGDPVVAPHGVTLINHQRGLPPLDRDHKNVFTEAQVGDAVENGTGLMTTWDLFRLIRGMDLWGWDPRCVQDVFYGKGWIGERPSHYREVGKVFKFYGKPNVVSVLIDDGMVLKEGDRVGYVFRDRFHEETALGIQVEGVNVAEAIAGQKVGYKTALTASDLKEGTVVYLASFVR